MKRLALLLFLTACAHQTKIATTPAPTESPLHAEIRRFEEVITKDPSNLPYTYALAMFYDQTKDPANVARVLERLEARNWDFGVGPDRFQQTLADPRVAAVAERLNAREQSVSNAVQAFTMPKERNVRSEGSAWDPVDRVFYYSGGADKLLRIDRAGAIQEVSIEPPGQRFGRLGMDVDATRRQLWAVSTSMAPDAPEEEKGRSGISVYSIPDGRLLRRVMRGSAAERSFFNDLTLLRDGTAFITDTSRNEVVALRPGSDSFETIATGLEEPNGIAVSADERTLYVADFRGIEAIDLATGRRSLLESTMMLHGIDGLVEHEGSLIGIHNVLGNPRILRIHPADGNRVEILEAKNPLMKVPTTGVVAEGEYYFIANLWMRDTDRVVLKIRL